MYIINKLELELVRAMYARGDHNNVVGCYSSFSLMKQSHTDKEHMILFPVTYSSQIYISFITRKIFMPTCIEKGIIPV